MFQGRSAILWRLAEWTSFGPDDARSIWVQPEHFKPEKHELLKFTSKEDAEQWIIEEQLRDPRFSGTEMGAIQITEKGVVHGSYV